MLKTKIIKVATSIVAFTLASSSYATTTGFYLGGQLGWGNIHQSLLDNFVKNQPEPLTSSSHSSTDTGLAGRLFSGYQFNENWAAELGWTRFSNAAGNASWYYKYDSYNAQYQASSTASSRIQANAVDLVAKAILPLAHHFNIYGKLGVAYLIETAHVTVTEKSIMNWMGYNSTYSGSSSASDTQRKLLPTFGAGIGYEITQNVTADLSWNHIQKIGNTDLANTDLISLGLAYHFS